MQRQPLIWGLTLTGIGLMFGMSVPVEPATSTYDPTLKIGIVQRFGDNPDWPQLDISAPQGSELILEFANAQGRSITQQTPNLQVEIVEQALTTPEQVQRLILSSHRSFESAYARAEWWEETWDIQTEIAQPDEWQVWADRSTYTPDQLKQVLENAHAQDHLSVRWFEEEQTSQPLLSWEVDHYRYNRNRLQIRSTAGYLHVNDRTYAGSLTIQPNAYGTYSVVNAVPLETYLRGVVPHEVGPGAPPEAVAAQAILARTYALKNLHRFEIDDYQLCANTHCQVYKGLTGTVAGADAAIERTAGQVLTYDGQLIDAVYSSTSGGITAAFEDIWDGDPRPYLRSLKDTLDSAATPHRSLDLSQSQSLRQFLSQNDGFNESGVSRFFRWQVSYSLAELSNQLRANQRYFDFPMPEWTQIASLTVLERAASGRVQALQVDLNTETGVEPIVLGKDQIRLGFRKLLSTLFDLEPIGSGEAITGYVFLGGGFGHGVGMSQYGSYTLARQGYTANQILDFYYPGTTLKPLQSLSAEFQSSSQDGSS